MLIFTLKQFTGIYILFLLSKQPASTNFQLCAIPQAISHLHSFRSYFKAN